MMYIFGIRAKSLAALLVAFMALAMLPACSSSEETEDAVDCDNPANADEAERCIQDLDV